MSKDKAGNFVRLAEKRLANVLEAIRVLGNLSNRGNYTYTDEQAQNLIAAIREAVEEAKMLFGITAPPPPPPPLEASQAVWENPMIPISEWQAAVTAGETTSGYMNWMDEKRAEGVPEFVRSFHVG
ncbi:hypothetical protein ACUN0C_18960 [Faunimonas sp. B44]|uniref:hypothetical protein n=1 Tax=Faunimonas sp. B44 TaxID=3461493 RepID=UPI0040440788